MVNIEKILYIVHLEHLDFVLYLRPTVSISTVFLPPHLPVADETLPPNIQKMKIVKTLWLFLHQNTFIMFRPRVPSIRQWWNCHPNRGENTAQYKIRLFCVNAFVMDISEYAPLPSWFLYLTPYTEKWTKDSFPSRGRLLPTMVWRDQQWTVCSSRCRTFFPLCQPTLD